MNTSDNKIFIDFSSISKFSRELVLDDGYKSIWNFYYHTPNPQQKNELTTHGALLYVQPFHAENEDPKEGYPYYLQGYCLKYQDGATLYLITNNDNLEPQEDNREPVFNGDYGD